MRFYDNGSFYSVSVSSSEIESFNRRWPCSILRGRYWFQFDKRNGDLVDMTGYGDGPEVLALSQDAQKFGMERLQPRPMFTLQRVRLNSGGYTDRGEYFGTGEPLYYFASDEQLNQFGHEVSGHLRAADRADAKEQLRKRFKGARFYA